MLTSTWAPGDHFHFLGELGGLLFFFGDGGGLPFLFDVFTVLGLPMLLCDF